ncbi:hypothetical protein [Aequorivita vladivostokensis]|uniref:Uncharacterized protein n=1 Tax=Aequorivita vladivostokensis TaxID=171194 RepID=A0ABR5DM91_9FLAO|nr:hypothetical protein [Aequorivita vladivostokensis]KJJ39883.1 hypothetical protein MB09_01555 [Aequorivita vladivostokensis]
MKKHTHTVTVYQYRNPKLETHINEEHEKFLKDVEHKAKEYASSNKPEVDFQEGKTYLDFIPAKYQDLIVEAKKQNQPEINHYGAVEKGKQLELREGEISNEINNFNHKIGLKKAEIQRFEQSTVNKDRRWKRRRPFLYAILGADTVLASSLFEIIGLPFYGAIILAIGYGLSLLIFSEYSPTLIRLGKTKFQKIGISVALSLFLISCFYYLANLRIIQLSNYANVFSEGLSEMAFVLFNYLIFISVALYAYFNKPTKEEKIKIDELNVRQKELKNLEKEKDRVLMERNDLGNTNISHRVTSLQVSQYAQNTELELLSKLRIAHNLFIETNIKYRPDKLVPVCFNKGLEPLQTFYQKRE